jgi:hypothetical protein
MAGVTIDSGPVDPTYNLRDVAPENWGNLMRVRRDFLSRNLQRDCRCLLEFADDADVMAAPLGFASAEDFIRHGLEQDPQQVGWAIDGLRRMRPDEPIPYRRAIALGKHGTNQHTPGVGNTKSSSTGGTTVNYILARLDRDGHADLATAVRAGAVSANAAAIHLGWRSKPTPLEQVLKLLPKLTNDECRVVHEATASQDASQS